MSNTHQNRGLGAWLNNHIRRNKWIYVAGVVVILALSVYQHYYAS